LPQLIPWFFALYRMDHLSLEKSLENYRRTGSKCQEIFKKFSIFLPLEGKYSCVPKNLQARAFFFPFEGKNF